MARQLWMLSCAFGALMLVAGGARAATDAAASTTASTTAEAPASTTTFSDVVVTAERRQENLQSTPVQVSAFTDSVLKARRLDGGESLELSVPNMNYSRTFFGGYSLEIRGVGSQSVGGGGEPGVTVAENFVSVQNNHFADTDFFDTERVEVERGPQGTLYGRSATAGAVNIITNKPTSTFGASVTGEYGSFNKWKFNGYVNVPLGDMFAVRVAGFSLKRDGVGTNTFTGQSVDGRDLWAVRGTISFKPNDRFRAYLMFEHFEEDDDRNTVGKQLCFPDPGPTSVGGVATSPIEQGFLSQGCKNVSLYNPGSYGLTNSSADLAGIYGLALGLLNGNATTGHPLQDTNLHDIEAPLNPHNTTHEHFMNLNMSWDVTDNLQLESITGWNQNDYFYQRDYNRFVANVPFNTTPPSPVSAGACLVCLALGGVGINYAGLYQLTFPGGVINDPQVGSANRLRIFDQGDGHAVEWTQELRLTSSFNGPVNFSVGGLYYHFHSHTDYYVFFNPLTALAQVLDRVSPGALFIDPNNPPASVGPTVGHNYYLSSANPSTASYAGFGEVYWNITPALKLTGGLRVTEDQKTYGSFAIPLAVAGPRGLTARPTLNINTLATTGRAILSWTPQTTFSDQTMVYASFSRGYKALGFNTPCTAASGCPYPASSQPEYDNAFEIGAKNTFMGGRLVLNLAGFYSSYKGYQVSTIIAKSSVNQNIDTNIYGLEFESIWSPVDHLTLNAQVGLLHTEIVSGAILDQMNLTQGNPNLTLIKAADGSNCVVNTAGLAALLNTPTVRLSPAGAQQSVLLGSPLTGGSKGICGGQYGFGLNTWGLAPPAGGYSSPTSDPFGVYNYSASPGTVLFNGVGQGVNASLKGNRLPNAPAWTVSIGGQYVWDLPNDWSLTARADYYWQDFSYARIFNDSVDYLKAWDNINATLTLASRPWGLTVQLYGKNLANNQPLTTTAISDSSAGLLVNTFAPDPRTFGVAVTKHF